MFLRNLKLKVFSYTTTGLGLQQLLFNFAGPQEQAKLAVLQRKTVELQETLARNDVRITVE